MEQVVIIMNSIEEFNTEEKLDKDFENTIECRKIVVRLGYFEMTNRRTKYKEESLSWY